MHDYQDNQRGCIFFIRFPLMHIHFLRKKKNNRKGHIMIKIAVSYN